MSTTNPFWLSGVSNPWQGKWCQGVHSKHYPFPHLRQPHLSPWWLFPGKCQMCTLFYWTPLMYSKFSSSDTLSKANYPNLKVKSRKKKALWNPPLLYSGVSSQRKKKKIKALFFLSLVQCQWCFSELRSFRAAENFSLAYWIEFFWLLISELLLLFAESFWQAGTGFDSICQQFLFNYRKGERGGPGRFWGTQAHPNLHDRKK